MNKQISVATGFCKWQLLHRMCALLRSSTYYNRLWSMFPWAVSSHLMKGQNMVTMVLTEQRGLQPELLQLRSRALNEAHKTGQ